MKRQSLIIFGDRRRETHELTIVILLTTLFVLLGILLIKNSTAQPANDGTLIQDVKPDRSAYELGSPITIRFGIHNACKQPITYTFPNCKLFDLWIMRAGREIYRLSKGKAYAAVVTSLTLQPDETRTFDVIWNQKDNCGNEMGPGSYAVYAQLTPFKNPPPPADCTVQIGTRGALVIPLTVRGAIARADVLKDRLVHIVATYRGWQPNSDDPNVKDGPPVSRSDWAICESSACMYVHGNTSLDPVKDLDTKVDVTGKLLKTAKGQVYLELQTAKVIKPQP